MSNFKADLTAFARKAKLSVDEAVKEVVIELHGEIDRRSPVGNPTLWKSPAPAGYVGGHFRANNQYRFEKLPKGIIDGVDATGDATVSAVRASIASAQASGIHYIANNVDYAIDIENGYSKTQAPQGVYKLAMMSTVSKLKKFKAR